MRGFAIRWLVVLAVAAAPAAAQTDEPLQVGFLIEDGVYNTELTAPLDLLHHTRFHVDPGMHVFTVAPTLTQDVVTTFEGLKITPDFDYASAPRIDVLVVPSAERHVQEDFDDPALIEFVKARARDARFVMSLCDGAFVLAKAGLLDGKLCTTFPADIRALRERYPQAQVVDGVSFVVDGKVVTSVGGAQSFAPALWLIERLYGATPAQSVARGLVIDWDVDQVAHLVAAASRQPSRAWAVDDTIDGEVVVGDADGNPVRVLDLPQGDERVVVLVVFGGGDPSGTAKRGGLWCEDSFNDLPLVRHAMARFADKGVHFVGVACPPVFHEQRFGFDEGAFAAEGELYERNRRSFVAATQAAVESGVIPFEPCTFDPRFRLLGKEPGPGAASWEGRFRAAGENQAYGTPTVWILARDGTVLVPPLHANNYEKDVVLRYTARELEAAIRRALEITAPAGE